MRIIGIDPGIKGGLAQVDTIAGRFTVASFPTMSDKNDYDVEALADRIRGCGPDMAYLEQVHSMPRQGVSSTFFFFFGKGYGILIGILSTLEVPIVYVTPQKWKKHFNLSSDKDESQALATQLYPNLAPAWKLKKHNGRAEAALIAGYGIFMFDRGIDLATFDLNLIED